MVRTKSKLRVDKTAAGDDEDDDGSNMSTTSDGNLKYSDPWDNITGLNGKTLKATVIRTYSKIRPRRTILTPVIEPSFPKPSEQAEKELNSLRSNEKTPGKRTHQASNSPERSAKRLRTAPRSTTKKPNRTTISPGSMVAGTMMVNGSDAGGAMPMSLCSMVDNTTEPDPNGDSHRVHNSTVDLAKNCSGLETFADYVPNDISVIKGDGDPKLYLSVMCNQDLPLQMQVPSLLDTAKKVQFSTCPTPKHTHGQSTKKPNKRRSILKVKVKIPRRTSNKPTPPKISSGTPHSNIKSSLSKQTDVVEYNSYQSKDTVLTHGSGIGLDTKNLDLEALPSQLSDESSKDRRDATPETVNSKLSSSGKGSTGRRLLYPSHENDPKIQRCLILDIPETKHKKATVLCGKSCDIIQPHKINSLSSDLLCLLK